MITIETKKFSHITNSWRPYMVQQVTEKEAKQIIDIMKQRPPVQGFYQHVFRLAGQVFVIDTLHFDLKGFIQSFKGQR